MTIEQIKQLEEALLKFVTSTLEGAVTSEAAVNVLPEAAKVLVELQRIYEQPIQSQPKPGLPDAVIPLCIDGIKLIDMLSKAVAAKQKTACAPDPAYVYSPIVKYQEFQELQKRVTELESQYQARPDNSEGIICHIVVNLSPEQFDSLRDWILKSRQSGPRKLSIALV